MYGFVLRQNCNLEPTPNCMHQTPGKNATCVSPFVVPYGRPRICWMD